MTSMNELFHWAIQNTPARDPNESVPENKDLQPIDKKWLDLILKSDASKMKELLDIFQDPVSTFEEREAALEELEFYVETIDNASDLHHPKVNGIVPMLEGLKTKVHRVRCASVLQTALANNAKVQNEVLDLDGAKTLMESLKSEIEDNDGSLDALGKLVSLFSALIQKNPRAQKELWQMGAFGTLQQILELNIDHFQSKLKEQEQKEEKLKETESKETKQEEKSIDETKPNPETEGKHIVATFDIVEVKERVTKRAQQIKRWNTKKEQKDLKLEWLRLARKIVFIFYRLMADSEQFKLAFVKSTQGNIIKTLIKLLDEHQDPELKEKIGFALQSLLTSGNPTLTKYIRGELQQYDLKNIVEKQKKNIEQRSKEVDDYDYESLIQLYSDIHHKLSE